MRRITSPRILQCITAGDKTEIDKCLDIYGKLSGICSEKYERNTRDNGDVMQRRAARIVSRGLNLPVIIKSANIREIIFAFVTFDDVQARRDFLIAENKRPHTVSTITGDFKIPLGTARTGFRESLE